MLWAVDHDSLLVKAEHINGSAFFICSIVVEIAASELEISKTIWEDCASFPRKTVDKTGVIDEHLGHIEILGKRILQIEVAIDGNV